jgi:hypothetical protein
VPCVSECAAPGGSMHGRMNARTTHRPDRDAVREAVQGFYEQHPYPPPPSDLERYRRRWEDVSDGDFTNHVHLDSSRLINGPAHRDAKRNESVGNVQKRLHGLTNTSHAASRTSDRVGTYSGVTLVARTNSFVRESKEQSQCYHGQAKLVRATSPGALGTQEKVPALSR